MRSARGGTQPRSREHSPSVGCSSPMGRESLAVANGRPSATSGSTLSPGSSSRRAAMRPDDRQRLLQLARGQDRGVTGVTGVTSPPPAAHLVTPVTPVTPARTAPAACDRAELAGGWSLKAWWMWFEERAAIREFDGGFSRSEAERLALEDAVAHWLRLNPAPASNPRSGCAYCQCAEQLSNALIPLVTTGGHIWIHDRCWDAWRASRRTEAATALRRIGLRLQSESPPPEKRLEN